MSSISIEDIEREAKDFSSISLDSIARRFDTYPNKIKRIVVNSGRDLAAFKQQLEDNKYLLARDLILKNYDETIPKYELLARHYLPQCGASVFEKAFSDLMSEGLLTKAKCENCETLHDRSYTTGRFCSKSCSKSYSQSHITPEGIEIRNRALRDAPQTHKGIPYTDEMKAAKSRQMKKYFEDHPEARELVRKNSTGRVTSTETKRKLSESMKERIANGTHKGWQSRNIESYPEKIWRGVLEEAEIPFERELALTKDKHLGLRGQASNYFLDFFIIGRDSLIDLEIDGKQHQYPERKESDAVRDVVLAENGITVIRLPWTNPAHDKDEFQAQKEWLLQRLRDAL